MEQDCLCKGQWRSKGEGEGEEPGTGVGVSLKKGSDVGAAQGMDGHGDGALGWIRPWQKGRLTRPST
eukprot:13695018-Ditylum_brightwellii.AAC.1